MTLLLIILFSLIGSVGSVILVSSIVLLPDKIKNTITKNLVGFSLGTLLGSSLLVMLPEAIHHNPGRGIYFAFVGGLFIFFLIEKIIILSEHDHHAHGSFENNRTGNLIIIGDSFHNFLDGIIITTAFMTSVSVGVITSIIIFIHEIPQEAGDFSILLESGYSPKKALIYNVISGTGSLAGSLLSYLFLFQIEKAVPYIMSAAASVFIYIALSGLVPQLNKEKGLKGGLKQVSMITFGIMLISLFEIGHGH